MISGKNEIIELFKGWNQNEIDKIVKLPQSGSYREYYRLNYSNSSVIGVYNSDIKENKAFFYLSDHFMKKELPVPKILQIGNNNNKYLLEDLGDNTLFQFIQKNNYDYKSKLLDTYHSTIDHLIQFQVIGSENLNYKHCYPRAKFDSQSIFWDLWYFKYYFLKLAKITFDEQILEDSFHNLVKILTKIKCNFFLYRDFQSDNIMIKNDKLYFIDYQGGRQGPLYYDIASLLFDSKANIPFDVKTNLMYYYYHKIKDLHYIQKKDSSIFSFISL